ADVGHIRSRLDHVGKRCAGAAELVPDLPEDLDGLVVGRSAEHDTVGVHGRRAADENQRSGFQHTAEPVAPLPRRRRISAQSRDAQCLKCRRLVNTIVAPAASTAATTSWSRTEPPGWMIALIPASSAACGPSGNGKNASD